MCDARNKQVFKICTVLTERKHRTFTSRYSKKSYEIAGGTNTCLTDTCTSAPDANQSY